MRSEPPHAWEPTSSHVQLLLGSSCLCRVTLSRLGILSVPTRLHTPASSFIPGRRRPCLLSVPSMPSLLMWPFVLQNWHWNRCHMGHSVGTPCLRARTCPGCLCSAHRTWNSAWDTVNGKLMDCVCRVLGGGLCCRKWEGVIFVHAFVVHDVWSAPGRVPRCHCSYCHLKKHEPPVNNRGAVFPVSRPWTIEMGLY